jgi:hypothetical protein
MHTQPIPDPRTHAMERELAELSGHIEVATHRQLELIRELERTGIWHVQGATSYAAWLGWRIGLAPSAAREKIRVARALGKLPLVDERFRAAKLSYSKVRAITRVADDTNERALVDAAVRTTAADLETICRGLRSVERDVQGRIVPSARPERWLRERATDCGMVRIQAQLHPDEARLVWKAIDAARGLGGAGVLVDRADGLVRIADAFLSSGELSGRTGGERASIVVHVRADAPVASPGARTPLAAAVEVVSASAEAGLAGSVSTSTPWGGAPAETTSDARECTGASAEASPFVASPEQARQGAASQAASSTSDPLEAGNRNRGGAWEPTVADWTSSERSLDVPLTAWTGLTEWSSHPSVGSATDFDDDHSLSERDRSPTAPDVRTADPRGRALPTSIVLDDGTRIPAETFRRLACDATVSALEVDERGVPRGAGRRTRVVAGATRRALLARDWCCRFPGCTHRAWVDAHHIEHWARGGATVLDNLVLLCTAHHRLVHEGGFSVELSEGAPVFRRPCGTVLPDVPETTLGDGDILGRRWRDAGLEEGPAAGCRDGGALEVEARVGGTGSTRTRTRP